MGRDIYLLTWKMLILNLKIAYNSIFVENKLQIDRWLDGDIYGYRHIVIDINENK